MVAPPVIVREVWRDNLDHELNLIQQSITHFPFASFDTEFPGTVVHPSPDIPKYSYSSLPPSDTYSLMKKNVDVLHLIQFGLTLSDANGNLPTLSTTFCYVWQFNFCDFDPQIHRHNPDAIQLLLDHGTNFTKNKNEGIDSRIFGEKFRLILASIAIRDCIGLGYVTWITFHGTYDFGILIKILSGKELPDQLDCFMKLVGDFFGAEVYDLKVIGRHLGLQGNLDRVAQSLDVVRTIGMSHQAGSDSLLIMRAFLEMEKRCFDLLNKKKLGLKVQGLSTTDFD